MDFFGINREEHNLAVDLAEKQREEEYMKNKEAREDAFEGMKQERARFKVSPRAQQIDERKFQAEMAGRERQQDRDFFGTSATSGVIRDRQFRKEMAGKRRQQDRDFFDTTDRSEILRQKQFSDEMNKRVEAQKRELFERSAAGQAIKASQKVGFEVGRAAEIGMRQQVDFSGPQKQLQQMFGGGSKIWGVNMQPVTIHNDLNSSRSDPFDETAGMFGFGRDGERSGLF